ncbi:MULTISPECIES: murein L,D-transpeptidase catalytic domain family protein [Pseudomonas]|uniref:Murein L,D-transpeptidase catalytic domain family protein n=1 Tax=Pseudomonas saxonica TaxID=2600598 RepID=A0A5C5PT02_9PSED|nr:MULTISPECIES: murein L,D-transpeptidase catalytic domain family protein [Pseudomonas]MCH4874920.1 murein L,D-transpeptidase catalytic domain family protein [Pseudomonas sp. TMW22091]TWR85712.1 murein L,D-transpeptidase catalytic domain family protein [Pseudomonas saxonica]TWR86691.1 murein L,D-transpeptidase catalytic domain family protein [Pseudomonas saxonica]WRQ74995.1 murein L,D-transpeptidase catalytic domain family protein [Pseudomonas saxonica]
MPITLRRLFLVAATLGALCNPAFAANISKQGLYNSLAQAAPELNPLVLQSALSAMQCAVNNGASPAENLAVIDYSQPSTARRLWIFDLHKKTLVLRDLVAHGQKSGENFATQFSNNEGSHQSSLGLFRTQESYQGANGYSLRMDGLEPGFNDSARDRAIVIHPASYVNPLWSQTQGRIGRSQGCPAVRPQIARTVVDKLKDGQFMFAWYPDQKWLQSSAYLNCKPRLVASIVSSKKG